jgi:hypothetical protein
VTPTPRPGPDLPVSPVDLPGLVDRLEERAAADVADDRTQDEVARGAREEGGAEGRDPEQDQTAAVPGAPEPPD